MGRFSVEFEVTNDQDLFAVELGLLAPEKIQRERLRGTVDSGGTWLVLPARVCGGWGFPMVDPPRSATLITVKGLGVWRIGPMSNCSAGRAH